MSGGSFFDTPVALWDVVKIVSGYETLTILLGLVSGDYICLWMELDKVLNAPVYKGILVG